MTATLHHMVQGSARGTKCLVLLQITFNEMVRENALRIKQRIGCVCSRMGIEPGSITIVAVAKGRTVEQIKEAIEAGLNDIAESRIQEALSKYNRIAAWPLGPVRIRWHMVGHLQRNKAKQAVRIFDLIHSVDSLRLAKEIDKQAMKIGKTQDILVQVNTSAEKARFGLSADGLIESIKECTKYKNINIKGLMTIAPPQQDARLVRPYFKRLRALRDEINLRRITENPLQTLSMGMSDDFEAAIEEGANMLRLGRAIFEG